MRVIAHRILSLFSGLFNFCLHLLAFVVRKVASRTLDPGKQHILISRPDAVGDLLLFSASLPVYRKLFPKARIVMIVMNSSFNYAEYCPWVDEVWSLPRRGFRLNPVERWRWCWRLARANFDIAINAVYSTDYRHLNCLVGWTHAPRRIAHRCLDRYAPRQHSFPYFTELVPSSQEWKFEIERNFDMLNYLGYTGTVSHKTEVWIGEDDRARAVTLKESLEDRSYAVLVPGSQHQQKIWPADNFVSVIKAVHEHYPIDWIIDGNKNERERCDYIAHRLAGSPVRVLRTAGLTSLRELSAIIESATLLVANDTGPIHIAAAVGTPTVCVHGGWFYGRFYPYPDNPLTVSVTNKLPCFNCHMRCILDEEECITKIKIADVVDAALKVLAQQSTRRDFSLRPSAL